jgi:hypothetical protein
LLHRLGYSSLRPRPRHRKADPEAQAEFKEQLPQRLEEVAQAHPGRRLRIFFQDESRFGQQGTTTNVWAPKGSRPTAVRQTEYEYLWVIGAVCPATGRSEGLLSHCCEHDVRCFRSATRGADRRNCGHLSDRLLYVVVAFYECSTEI